MKTLSVDSPDSSFFSHVLWSSWGAWFVLFGMSGSLHNGLALSHRLALRTYDHMLSWYSMRVDAIRVSMIVALCWQYQIPRPRDRRKHSASVL